MAGLLPFGPLVAPAAAARLARAPAKVALFQGAPAALRPAFPSISSVLGRPSALPAPPRAAPSARPAAIPAGAPAATALGGLQAAVLDRGSARNSAVEDRIAALMDGGRTAAAPVSAGSQEPPASDKALLKKLNAWSDRATPVRIRWRQKARGPVRETVAIIDTVTDVDDGRGRRNIIYTDANAGEIDVSRIESAAPAGTSEEKYLSAIRPKAAGTLKEQLARVGLSAGQLAEIRRRSRGFMTVGQLLRSGAAAAGGRGLSLGVTDNLDQYTAVVRAAGLVHWKVPYWKWFGDVNTPRTAEFMERATKGGGPLYMFLPPGLREEEYHPYTFEEFEWLMAHPDRMKNVRFVLGAYEMFSKENEGKLFSLGSRRGTGARRKLLLRLFRGLMGPDSSR